MLPMNKEYRLAKTAQRATSAVAAADRCAFVGSARNHVGTQRQLQWRKAGP
jgi:hypothetical protein